MVEPGLLVVCDGGGGIPVIEDHHGHQRGAYAVIDKDLASALLAGDLGVETLVLATYVEAVYGATALQRSGRSRWPRRPSFAPATSPPGSMGPKVVAVCRFVGRTGRRGVIGSLDDIDHLISGGRAPRYFRTERSSRTNRGRQANDRAA